MDSTLLKQKASDAERIIYSHLPKDGQVAGIHGIYDSRITEAVNYSVEAGGKRLRPILMNETYYFFGGSDSAESQKLLGAFMSAIEYIHTYSLVHDDLPAMDNDMLRRGKPTTHAVYGEAFGVLAGDALLNLAFETVLEEMAGVKDGALLGRAAAALRILAVKAGIRGMIGGQCMDVYSEKEGLENDSDQIMYIYANKTSALLQAAVMAGAILAGADAAAVTQMEEMALYLGLAFQIRDDILDVTSTTEELGKPVGSDEKNGKATYASLHGLEAAQKDVEMYSHKALAILERLGGGDTFLAQLVEYLTTRDN